MLGKLLVGFILVGGILAVFRALNRAATLSTSQKNASQNTPEDLVRCTQCGIYYPTSSSCLHCQKET